MDVYVVLRELWRNSDYMGALTAAWTLPATDNYPYFLSAVQVRDLTLRELIFRACRQAVAISFAGQSEQQRAVHWVDAFLHEFSPPAVLLDHGDGGEAEAYRRAMIRAHLLCVRALLLRQDKEQPWTASDVVLSQEFLAIVQATDLPMAFFRALLSSLFPEEHRTADVDEKRPTVSLTAFLVGERTAGVAATLTLALQSGGSGVLFPASSLAFVRRDPAFLTAEQTARRYMERLELWKADYDVCWLVERRDGQPIGALKGSSMGFAFALGLAKLLTSS